MSNVRRAVYAGSFDPPTVGHQWMIEQASHIFDEVIVAVAVNAGKTSTFSIEDRVKMLTSSTAKMPNIKVASFPSKFLVRYAKSVEATTSIRGLRNATDLQYELDMQRANEDLDSGIITLFLVPPRDYAYVSSSLVRGMLSPEDGEIEVARYVPQTVLSQMIGLKHKTWENLQKLGATGSKYEFWDDIFSAYMKPGRYYHDWKHPINMLNIFAGVRHLASNPTAVEFAILLHDYVYEIFANNNEALSKDMMHGLCEKYVLPKDFEDYVGELIMATTHSPRFTPKNFDEKLLVDVDLAILGSSPEKYDEYEEEIRKEYTSVPTKDFMEGRTRVLGYFLSKESIYYTEYFRNNFEAQARENLKRSIAKLAPNPS